MSQANKGIIPIKGKNYRTVAYRVNEFRTDDKYGGWCINTDIIQQTEAEVTMKTIISDQNGMIRGTGFANEVKGRGNINKTSHIENCETSAIGRALASIGLAGEEYASADELAAALIQQGEMKKENSEPELGVAPNVTELDVAMQYLFDAIGYSVKSRKITGSLADLRRAVKDIAANYSAETARKIGPFADQFEKRLTQEKGNAQAA